LNTRRKKNSFKKSWKTIRVMKGKVRKRKMMRMS